MNHLLISKLDFIIKVIVITIIYLTVFFALRIMFKDMKKSDEEQLEGEDTLGYSQGEMPEREHAISYSEGEQLEREDTFSYSQKGQSEREYTFSYAQGEQLEEENTLNYNENLCEEKEECHETVYSPLIDKIIGIWKYIENFYNEQLKRKRAFIDAQNINKPKNKYYNKIILSPISGKVYNSYYNHIFMNLALVLVIALTFSILFILELKFPFKLITVLPGAIFFLYLCKLYNYLSPFISRTKVLKRSLIYVNEKHVNEPVVSPVEGIIFSLGENNIEIKTSYGINAFISIKHTKWIEMCVKEGDRINLGEKLFKFGVENETTPIVFFYIGVNKPYKIKFIKKINCSVVKQNKTLYLATCIINEGAPILNNGDIISLSSYAYGDNEYGSKIVTANYKNYGYLMANCNCMDNEEKFLVVSQEDGTVALKSLYNDKYVSANLNFDGKLIANGNNIGTSEKFVFIGENIGTYIIIASVNNRVVSANFNAEGFLVAKGDHISISERFLIWKH